MICSESPESRKEFDVRVKELEIIEKLTVDPKEGEPHLLTIEWNSDDLTWDTNAHASISIWGYREKSDVYPSLTFIVELVQNIENNGKFELDLNNLPALPPLDDYEFTFGFIGINVTGNQWSQTLWSRPMPLG